MSEAAQNICFYSNKCQWSKAFITELSRTPWKNSFRFICVDPSPSRPSLPAWLKKVPTIVVKGENEPRTDSDVMNWLYEKKMKEGGGGGGGGGNDNLIAAGEAGAGGEPSAFSAFETTSFAKGFGYSGIDVDTSSQGEGGKTIPGAYAFLNGAAAVGDRMGQEMGPAQISNNRRSKKEELFDKQMEQYQREREMGMPKGPNRMGGGFQ